MALVRMDDILNEDNELNGQEAERIGKAVVQQEGEDFASIMQWLRDTAQWTGDETVAKIAAILHGTLRS